MSIQNSVLLPVHIFCALIIWKILRIDTWIKSIMEEYTTPSPAVAEKLEDLEKGLTELENQV